METLTRWAPSPLDSMGREDRRRRRRRRSLAFALLVPLLATVAAGFAYIARYQPLRADGWGSGVDDTNVVESFDASAPDGSDFRQYRLDVIERDDRVWFAFTLHNTGPLPTKILSVGSEPAPGSLSPLQQRAVLLGPPDAGAHPSPRHAERFAPFTLTGRTGIRYVIVDAQIGNCRRTPDPAVTTGSIDVTYELYGMFEKSATLTLPYTLEVPVNAACPDHGEG